MPIFDQAAVDRGRIDTPTASESGRPGHRTSGHGQASSQRNIEKPDTPNPGVS